MKSIRRILFHTAHIVVWVANIIICSITCSIAGLESATGFLSLCGIIVNVTSLLVAILAADLAYKERHSHSQGP